SALSVTPQAPSFGASRQFPRLMPRRSCLLTLSTSPGSLPGEPEAQAIAMVTQTPSVASSLNMMCSSICSETRRRGCNLPAVYELRGLAALHGWMVRAGRAGRFRRRLLEKALQPNGNKAQATHDSDADQYEPQHTEVEGVIPERSQEEDLLGPALPQDHPG